MTQEYGINQIGIYIPEGRLTNEGMEEKFQLRDGFVQNKIGVLERAQKEKNESVQDMCLKAVEDLQQKQSFDILEIDVIVLVTQNPDFAVPHTSAILHESLGAKSECVCFDISHGCAGFVYGLSIIESFMESNGYRKGVLFTCDPYSKIIDLEDKNTSMIFGDAATATMVSNENPEYKIGKFDFGTYPQTSLCGNTVHNGKMFMNGRKIFNLAVKYVPESYAKVLEKNCLKKEDLDYYVFHQGSKYIVDALKGRLECADEKVAFDIEKYGNTVSSTIPLILSRRCFSSSYKNIFISGFGIGLSWGSTVLFKEKK